MKLGRNSLTTAVMAAALGSSLTLSGCAADGSNSYAAYSQMKNSTVEALTDDTRVFKVDPAITVLKVSFVNRYGFEVVGHLYLPKDFDADKRYPALVITGPFGAVKEQSSGLYAQEMAERGLVAVAFDPSTTGQSGGVRRNMGSPEIFTEDVSAAVDFVSNLTFVDPEKIGGIGICGLSGMVLTAAVNDVRLKAVATSAMYDMSESISDHYKGDYYTPAQREAVKRHLALLRDQEAKSGESIRGAHELAVAADGTIQTFDVMFPDTLPEDANAVIKDFYGYYVGRAYHPRAINSNTSAWDSTTPYGFFNFNLMENLKELAPRPVLLITGSAAHSKYFSDEVYAKAAQPKEELVVPGATHVDLYDQYDKIPFDYLAQYFLKNLK